jgi:hypothetical protein
MGMSEFDMMMIIIIFRTGIMHLPTIIFRTLKEKISLDVSKIGNQIQVDKKYRTPCTIIQYCTIKVLVLY